MTTTKVPPRSNNNIGIQSWQNTGAISPYPEGYHTSFRWATKFGYICRENSLPEPIRNLDHYDMVLTWVTRLSAIMLWSTTFLHSFTCTNCSMWTIANHASHHFWTHQRLQNSSLETQLSRSFLISRRNSTQWGPLLPKGGGMIQVDIGGHPPIPFGPPQLSLSVFQFP